MFASLKQPRPFYLIFILEFWERFGYYGVQALLVLFMVQQLGHSDDMAEEIFAGFSALVFLLPAIGGYLGDNVYGTKRCIFIGAVVLAIGYGLLAMPDISNAYVVVPLAFIAVGNGLFKANPSSLISKVYHQEEQNSDSGFTLYYMAINLGALFSMLLTPLVNKYFGWHWAFFVCFIGLLIVLLSFKALYQLIAPYGSAADDEPLSFAKKLSIPGLVVLMTLGCYFLLTHRLILIILLALCGIAFLSMYAYLFFQSSRAEKPGMLVFVILFFQALIFFVLYFQMPTSLTLFALRNVEHNILGFHVAPASFQALNAAWIVILSPLLALIYQYFGAQDRDLSIPTKFAFGTICAGAAFLILPLGGKFATHGVIDSGWLVASYALQSLGELLVSALGLSMVSTYIPQRYMGFVMGVWFLCSSISSIVAGKIAALASIPTQISTNPIASLPIYTHLFMNIGTITVTVGMVMLCCVPIVNRLLIVDKNP